jgi:phosphate transport system substrate-binding protein
MMLRRVFPRIAVAVLFACSMVPLLPSTAAPAATSYTTVFGAGSTWSAIAIAAWQRDVALRGIPVNYQPLGSTAGRVYYYQDQADFAGSEIPFQAAYRDATGTVTTDEIALAAHRPYAYLPDVAGGTSIMYHLDVAGQRVTNLRLSPTTLAKIFTLVITNWDDPAITADNGGRQLPSLPIKAVVRSDGSGTTAQFTAFMANQTPDIWNAFCHKESINITPCPPTSLYPPDPNLIAQQLSDGVANFVAAPYNNGAITYVEYGYAKNLSFPVASLLNRAGYYTQPTALNVAIALERAVIHPDFTQDLSGVYVNPDPNTYPMSSYSYLIVPTTTAAPFNTAKGNTLGAFILYAVCAGQQKVAQLGYSPLPANLVQFAFEAEKLIPGAPAPPPISQCANPTITGAFSLKNAPPPPPGSHIGDPVPAGPGQTGNTTPGSKTSNVAGAGTKTGTGATTSTTVPNGLGGITPSAQNGQTQLVASSGPVTLPGKSAPMPLGLYILAAGLVLLIVFAPPTVAVAMRSRERGRRRGSG